MLHINNQKRIKGKYLIYQKAYNVHNYNFVL